MLNNLFMSLFTVGLIVAVILSTFKRKATSSKNKKIAWISVAVAFVLAVTTMPPSQEKAGEKPEPTPTITKTITPKPNIDPWTQWNRFNVNWAEYSLDFEKLLLEKFAAKDCIGLQAVSAALFLDNEDHIVEYGHDNINMISFVNYLSRQAKCYR
jgi:hypothetical protein